MTTVSKPSPNFNDRPKGVKIDAIVLHSDSSKHAAGSISWIQSRLSKVSYHALVDRDGTVYTFVPPEKRAWHAGRSTFEGRGNVNDFSIGVSFANDNVGEAYTEAQYRVGAQLVAGYLKKFPAITVERITTHAVISPKRKTDPAGFDLERFKDLVSQSLTGVCP